MFDLISGPCLWAVVLWRDRVGRATKLRELDRPSASGRRGKRGFNYLYKDVIFLSRTVGRK